ncbi:DUF4352 domain-containing protein [Calidifontibacter terrae]
MNNQNSQPNNQPNQQQGTQWHGQQPPAYGPANHLPPTPPYVQAPPPKKSWFLRHKILSGLGALVLVAAIGSAVSGGGGANSNAAASSSDTGTSAAANSASSAAATDSKTDSKSAAETATQTKTGSKVEKKDPGLGTPVRDGKFEFTVTKVKTGVKSIGDQYLGKQAQGSFVLISVTVKNIGDKSQTMFDDNQKVTDTQGRQFSADTEASIYLKNNNLWMNEINPGNTATGTLIYDMPAGATPASLELHDSAFSGGVTVSLK